MIKIKYIYLYNWTGTGDEVVLDIDRLTASQKASAKKTNKEIKRLNDFKNASSMLVSLYTCICYVQRCVVMHEAVPEINKPAKPTCFELVFSIEEYLFAYSIEFRIDGSVVETIRSLDVSSCCFGSKTDSLEEEGSVLYRVGRRTQPVEAVEHAHWLVPVCITLRRDFIKAVGFQVLPLSGELIQFFDGGGKPGHHGGLAV